MFDDRRATMGRGQGHRTNLGRCARPFAEPDCLIAEALTAMFQRREQNPRSCLDQIGPAG